VTELGDLQGEFQDYLLRGEPVIERRIRDGTRVPAATRLAIYGNAYRSRLADALAANFPALAVFLGEADFANLARLYVREHDSPFFNIRYYGDALPEYLATREDYIAAPVLAELARWEWAMMAAFDAADVVPVGHESLARFPPEQWAQLRFTFHPSLQRLGLLWNVPQLWQAVSDGTERPEVSLHANPVQWLVWRQELSTYFRSLPQTEAAALDAARSGWPFGELCELLCEEVGEEAAPVEAATLLRGWVTSGLIVAAG
jgi:hypothetical protein